MNPSERVKCFIFPGNLRHGMEMAESEINTLLRHLVVKDAVGQAGIAKRATCQTLRHSGVFPALCGTAHLLEAEYGICTVQELLGHRDVRTTMIYTHVLNRGGKRVRRPADTP